MRRRLALWLAAAPLVTCGDDTTEDVPPTVDLGVGGGFTAEVLEGDRLVITASDGRVLLDGLAPGTVEGEGPPLVGFATRDVTTTYEMQFGAFKPTITPLGAWEVATRLAPTDKTIRLEAGGKELASLALAAEEDGHLTVDLRLPEGLEVDAAEPETRRKLSWGFACDAEDHFSGFGAQTWDTDHRGQTVPTFVTEGGIGKSETDDYIGLWMLQGQRHSSQAPLPQVLARRGYVLTVESDRRSVFVLCSETEDTARIEIDLPARVHVFDGPSPAEALERASATFGRPRMPPLVSFAPWFDAIMGSENVRRVAQKIREEGIPSSVIWTEDWRGGEYSSENYALKEEWEVDRELYPDFEAVADDLHTLGFHFHVYFNPFIYMESKAWEETEPSGMLVKRADGSTYTFTGAKFTETGLLDLDNPDARAWAIGKMQDAIALGADGWMHDFAEWLPTDGQTAAGPSYERHNVWPVLWQQLAREAIDGVDDGVERLFFARSAWLGSPELVDVFWAGDQQTSFSKDDGMHTIVPASINLGIVGLSTYGHDIAGYQSGVGPGSTKELYFRWTELGAWSPVMRTHHGLQPDRQWNWEKDAETTAHFKRYAELHMALVPTMAGLARHAADTGLPILRGMALAFPEDAEVWSIVDQVMLGDGVLIAPVVTEGATEREVYFPEGRWHPWSGGDAIEGPARVSVDAAVEEIPVFARSGAIVPMFPPGVMTLVNESDAVPGSSAVGDDRIVLVVLGANGSFTEAGGLSYALASEAVEAGSGLTVRFEGEGLAECEAEPISPCFEVASGETIVRVEGAGQVELEDDAGNVSTLELGGGDGSYELHIRR